MGTAPACIPRRPEGRRRTRRLGATLNVLAHDPVLRRGSADLGPSNRTTFARRAAISKQDAGRKLAFRRSRTRDEVNGCRSKLRLFASPSSSSATMRGPRSGCPRRWSRRRSSPSPATRWATASTSWPDALPVEHPIRRAPTWPFPTVLRPGDQRGRRGPSPYPAAGPSAERQPLPTFDRNNKYAPAAGGALLGDGGHSGWGYQIVLDRVRQRGLTVVDAQEALASRT